MTAIAGTYQNVKFLTTIGVARVTIDILMDDWEKHSSVLGNPPSQDGAKKYVALTRISEESFKRWAGASAPEVTDGVAELVDARDGTMEGPALIAGSTPAPAPKREYTRSQMAAIKCAEVSFQWWLMNDVRPQDGRCWPKESMSANAKADLVLKEHLGIKSKTELDFDPSKAKAFDRLLTDYDTRGLVR